MVYSLAKPTGAETTTLADEKTVGEQSWKKAYTDFGKARNLAALICGKDFEEMLINLGFVYDKVYRRLSDGVSGSYSDAAPEIIGRADAITNIIRQKLHIDNVA
jgi:hypothetical protein